MTKSLIAVALLLASAVILSMLMAFPLMWLWNGCAVGLVDGLHPIKSVWTAWGLAVLCNILFKTTSSSKD